MKIYRFDPQVGREITAFDSRNVLLSRMVLVPDGETRVGFFYLGAGGRLGYHRATVPQLFAVVAGAGWVRGADEQRTPISAGYAAFWQAGEFHESGTNHEAMTVIVVEAAGLDPERFMTEA